MKLVKLIDTKVIKSIKAKISVGSVSDQTCCPQWISKSVREMPSWGWVLGIVGLIYLYGGIVVFLRARSNAAQ